MPFTDSPRRRINRSPDDCCVEKNWCCFVSISETAKWSVHRPRTVQVDGLMPALKKDELVHKASTKVELQIAGIAPQLNPMVVVGTMISRKYKRSRRNH